MSDLISIDKVFAGVALAIVSFMSWIGKEKFKKVNQLAETSVTRTEHNADMNRIDKKIDDGFNRIYDKLDKLK